MHSVLDSLSQSAKSVLTQSFVTSEDRASFPFSESRCENYVLNLLTYSATRLGKFCTLGNFIKPVTTIILTKLPTLLGNFCKGVKIFHFSSEIIFGQLS